MVNAFKSLILLLTVLAAVGSSPAHADLPDGAADGVDAYLEAYADDNNIPGLPLPSSTAKALSTSASPGRVATARQSPARLRS